MPHRFATQLLATWILGHSYYSGFLFIIYLPGTYWMGAWRPGLQGAPGFCRGSLGWRTRVEVSGSRSLPWGNRSSRLPWCLILRGGHLNVQWCMNLYSSHLSLNKALAYPSEQLRLGTCCLHWDCPWPGKFSQHLKPHTYVKSPGTSTRPVYLMPTTQGTKNTVCICVFF